MKDKKSFCIIQVENNRDLCFSMEQIGLSKDKEFVTINKEGIDLQLFTFASSPDGLASYCACSYDREDNMTVLSIPVHHVVHMYIKHMRKHVR